MRLLLDDCMDVRAATALRAAGHDVEHVQTWSSDPGDEEIMRIAYEQQRVLITLDNDFGKLVVVEQHNHAGLLRLDGFSTSAQAEALLAALAAHATELERGAIVACEPDKSRVRE